MEVREALSRFPVQALKLRVRPRATLKLPASNKGNTLRGAFGTAFRRLVCIPQCREARHCPLIGTCPYRLIFEPAPPLGTDRLSKNQDIPRPFIFRPPLDAISTYEPGQPFDFTLMLVGKAVDYLPYFVLAFREVAREGFGLNRVHCELEEVRSANPKSGVLGPERQTQSSCDMPEASAGPPGPGSETGGLPGSELVYSAGEQVFRAPQTFALADYVQARLAQLSHSSRDLRLSTVFLTPTYLKSEGQAVRQPEFHHLFKRVRDRVNALSTFYGPGPIDADFKGLGEAAEKVRTLARHVQWVDRSRHSSRTGQRHELSGFVGECTYEFPTDESGVSNLELLRWIVCGEVLGAGRHTGFGNGWFWMVPI